MKMSSPDKANRLIGKAKPFQNAPAFPQQRPGWGQGTLIPPGRAPLAGRPEVAPFWRIPLSHAVPGDVLLFVMGSRGRGVGFEIWKQEAERQHVRAGNFSVPCVVSHPSRGFQEPEWKHISLLRRGLGTITPLLLPPSLSKRDSQVKKRRSINRFRFLIGKVRSHSTRGYREENCIQFCSESTTCVTFQFNNI